MQNQKPVGQREPKQRRMNTIQKNQIDLCWVGNTSTKQVVIGHQEVTDNDWIFLRSQFYDQDSLLLQVSGWLETYMETYRRV